MGAGGVGGGGGDGNWVCQEPGGSAGPSHLDWPGVRTAGWQKVSETLSFWPHHCPSLSPLCTFYMEGGALGQVLLSGWPFIGALWAWEQGCLELKTPSPPQIRQTPQFFPNAQLNF